MSQFHYFKTDITGISTPEKFTFPFFYEPHQLSVIAANELKEYLNSQTDWEHNFGLDNDQNTLAIGKMFGVLVVRNQQDELGYLCAFSGKLANKNIFPNFVPPIFDMLDPDGFFLREETYLNNINTELEQLEASEAFLSLSAAFAADELEDTNQIALLKTQLKEGKSERKKIRIAQITILSPAEFELLEADLVKQSLRDKHEFGLKMLQLEQDKIKKHQEYFKIADRIQFLREERKDFSSNLQQRLFDQYNFLNKDGKLKSVSAIFAQTNLLKPPAAAGDCAAPKLLQYAFQNDLTPVCMAEFWWGESPKSEIRKHSQFYPSCTGKCEPILKHMLEGIELDPNPLLNNPALHKTLEIMYQDEDMVVVNKPADFLSVPGIHIQDSVYTRIQEMIPDLSGPIIIHRLDMATSGILVLAKHKEAHKILQEQFINRTIQKRYLALLEGEIDQEEGYIEFPIRVDLDDRPRQVVCYEYGKMAKTYFKVLEKSQGRTRIHYWPITGRTHQLRMHSSHHLGLNCPIVGDDLYGQKDSRLHLHAEYLELKHPKTGKTMRFLADCDF
ncbi:MAG: RluA family pseudouridine synthase [Flavobacterium sp.]|nr:RluA family pseudouridine synthase [Candidatus Neoflavobacterium equi]